MRLRIIAWFLLPANKDERCDALCGSVLVVAVGSFLDGGKKFIRIPVSRVIVLDISCIDIAHDDKPAFFVRGSNQAQLGTGWKVSHFFKHSLGLLRAQEPIAFRQPKRGLIRQLHFCWPRLPGKLVCFFFGTSWRNRQYECREKDE